MLDSNRSALRQRLCGPAPIKDGRRAYDTGECSFVCRWRSSANLQLLGKFC